MNLLNTLHAPRINLTCRLYVRNIAALIQLMMIEESSKRPGLTIWPGHTIFIKDILLLVSLRKNRSLEEVSTSSRC